MSKFISNQMHWSWKISFVTSLLWLIMWLIEGIDGLDMFVGLLPASIWFTSRWIVVGKDDVTE